MALQSSRDEADRLRAFVFCVPASAQAPQRPPLVYDPDKLEFATPWAQSSPCLGDYSDPICIAATVVVCGVLRERPECRPDDRYQRHYNPLNGNRIEYRILRAGYVPKDRLEYFEEYVLGAPEIRNFRLARRKATAAQIAIRQRICDPRRAACDVEIEAAILVNLEWQNRRWIYLNASMFRDDDWAAE